MYTKAGSESNGSINLKHYIEKATNLEYSRKVFDVQYGLKTSIIMRLKDKDKA